MVGLTFAEIDLSEEPGFGHLAGAFGPTANGKEQLTYSQSVMVAAKQVENFNKLTTRPSPSCFVPTRRRDGAAFFSRQAEAGQDHGQHHVRGASRGFQ